MLRHIRTLFVALALLTACGGTPAPTEEPHARQEHAGGEHHEGGEAPPAPTRSLDDGAQLFGAELDQGRAVTPLAEILAAPAQFEGQVVKTEGEIAQVCQRMGCWMELRSDANSPGIRVPMANHAFFLPRDVAGRRATIEGTVQLEGLSAEQREHLEAEGATATERALSIEATGVIVH
jgi:hypothetical protein